MPRRTGDTFVLQRVWSALEKWALMYLSLGSLTEITLKVLDKKDQLGNPNRPEPPHKTKYNTGLLPVFLS